MLNQNMISEAAHLTRAGRLVEATALPQRMLRGESAPEPSNCHARVAPARLEPLTIDLKANVLEEKESRRTTRSAPLQRKSAARFEGLKDFPGLNLRGPMTRAPPATTDTRAHVASRILEAARRGETSAEDLKRAGRTALCAAPTMWR